jgi:excisionase family DNA binding protein
VEYLFQYDTHTYVLPDGLEVLSHYCLRRCVATIGHFLQEKGPGQPAGDKHLSTGSVGVTNDAPAPAPQILDHQLRQEAFTIKQAAKVLGRHEDTIRRWCKTGKIKANRVGPKLILIPRSELGRLRTQGKLA